MYTHFKPLTKAIWFYSLAFGLSLAVALLAPLLGANTPSVAMFTPLAAVLLMFFVVTRDGYSKASWQELGLHRTGWRSWGLAVLVPLLVLGVAYSVAWSLGVGQLMVPSGQQLLILPFKLLISIAIGALLGALGEEVGWRGYLLPHLLSLGQTRALLLSGLLHGVWHLPVMLLTPYYHHLGNRYIVVTLFLLSLTAAGVFFGYLRLTTGSVWPAAIAHRAWNTFSDRFATLTVAVSPLALEYLAGESGLVTLIGIVLVAVWLLYRLNHQSRVEVVATIGVR